MTKEPFEQEMTEAMAVLDGASREVLIESLISASGTLYSLMNGEPGAGQEMELSAVQMAVEFVEDNQAAAVEAEALATINPARATIN